MDEWSADWVLSQLSFQLAEWHIGLVDWKEPFEIETKGDWLSSWLTTQPKCSNNMDVNPYIEPFFHP